MEGVVMKAGLNMENRDCWFAASLDESPCSSVKEKTSMAG